jgi:hypothetical protein
MDQAAGFGPQGWLPLNVRRAQAAEERAEAQQARAAEREKSERVEARRSADLTMLAAEADARGEYIDPVAVAAGRVTGRSTADVLEFARLASERQDAMAEDEARKSRGEKLNFVGLLEDPATRSVPAMTTTRRAIERTSERFTAAVTAAAEAGRRRGELEDVVPALREPHWASGRRSR